MTPAAETSERVQPGPGPVDVLGLDREALQAWVGALGHKPFRARQLLRWLHQRGADSFAGMSDLARELREELEVRATIGAAPVLRREDSRDGTRKWLIDVGAGEAVETVYIPEPGRGTLCVSSQAGCAVHCAFCATGAQGFSRNLTSGQIAGQLWMANRELRAQGLGERPVTNVVLMGMGEPLQNYDALLPALRLMLDDDAYGLSRRRVTVSAAGMVPMIDRLARDCPVALAVSLHAPDDALRDRLVPLNRKYPLRELLGACQRYLEFAPRDFITIEYVLLAGVNDSPQQARAVLALLRTLSCKVNLIAFNPYPGSDLRRPEPAAVKAFASVLQEGGLTVTTRRTRGDDIDAACGQLAGSVRDRTEVVLRRKDAVSA